VASAAEGDNDRRGFLRSATLIIGGAIGAVLAVPLVRYFLFPVGRKVVASGERPVGAVDAGALVPGGPPVRVPIAVRGQRDAWSTREEVTVGSAWVMKEKGGEVVALSAVCPHLGCSVSFDSGGGMFRCPCHRSSFARDGAAIDGPAKRGMDRLPAREDGGQVVVTFIRYKMDVAEKIES
jgi:menaquinol-cytochrome c reductase iron-sulfur subunit